MQLLKHILEDGIRTRAFPGAVVVVGDESRNLIQEAAGEAQLDTIYDVASLTKVVVTTTLAMMLFDEGKLDLDQRIDRYTIRQLLTHSAGLPEKGSFDLEYEPGTRALYSDVGFIILGRILEDLAGAPLDALARRRIFDPLGMKDSFFNPDPSLTSRIASTAPGIRGRVHDKAAAAMGGVSGHAGLFSTADDLAIFCRIMLRGGKTIELFTRLDGSVPGSTRALGWDTPSEEGSSSGHYFSKGSFGHTGFTGTSMWLDPVRKLYVIFLTNRVYPNSDNLEIRQIRPKLHDAVMTSGVGGPAGKSRVQVSTTNRPVGPTLIK
jgi:CubicO group peptidase (beta-lactamase class C family)